MKISSFDAGQKLALKSPDNNLKTDSQKNVKSFQTLFEKAVNEVNGLEKDASQKSVDVLLGKSNNIHDAMIAAEKAKIAMNLTIEVSNKLLEAYKEVNRLQV